MTDVVFLLIGIALGGFVGWLTGRSKQDIGLSLAQSQFQNTQQELQKTQQLLEKERLLTLEQTRQIASLEADYRNLEDQLQHQKEELTLQFKSLANDLLEEKSKRFTEQNRLQIDQILSPLSQKIQQFEQKVDTTYREELRDKASLLSEVKRLHDLSLRLSDEAQHLTKALKGDTKQQGNWGEVILEKVLERSGLTNGVEYRTQVVSRGIAGDLIKPDVIVYLPDNKHLVIDAKVSLLAYEQFVNAEDDTNRQQAIRAHLASVRAHVRILADKDYYAADNLISPDFTMLFMPIEAAFSSAIQHDAELFNFAWDKRIVLVSPTTLLATLRTVSSIWKFEKQSKNAIEIARLGGEMYDKFEGFVKDLQKIGDTLKGSQSAYDEAVKKLAEGRGNLIKTAEKLKNLGARATKDLPKAWIEKGEEE
ncbi:MAG: DNA recombination protein RmuC [Spirosomataceae bacterium]